MKTLKQLLSENSKLIIILSTLIVYYEWRLYINNKCLSRKHITEFQNQNQIQRCFQNNISISEKQNIFFELSIKLNGLLNFGNEYQNFVNSIISHESKSNSTKFDNQQIETFRDLNNVLDIEIKSLTSQISNWREEQLNDISRQIQRNIESIQSPPKEKCDNIKKIYCRIPPTGVGSQIHGLMTCLLKGYYTKTMVVIDQIFMSYLKRSNSTWDQFISPISQTCQPNHTAKYEIKSQDSVINFAYDIANYLPKTIGQKLIALHADPKAFWFGQFVKYIYGPNKYMEPLIRNVTTKLGLPKLYVGIQIRRGDKIGKEAKSHSVEEYMFYVNNYFHKLALNGYSGEKSVFVATDDENVMKKLNDKYKDFKFFDSKQYSKNIKVDKNHYSPLNLQYTIIDIHFLSRSDYLVCTMSSNLCRLSYELMQTIRLNSALNYQSLDVPFYICYQPGPRRQFTYKHTIKSNNDKFDIEVESIARMRNDWWNIAMQDNTMDGHFEGSLEGNKKMTNFRFPLYKTKEKHSFFEDTFG